MAKKALLIGCNYPGMRCELRGCVNDVERMRRCLVDQYGFLGEDIIVLIDTDHDRYTRPTGKNIRDALSGLLESASPGDVLFVHFSGHGYRHECKVEHEDTGFTESIVATDFNLVTDYDFMKFVERVPKNCKITIVSDSCHSGGLIEGAKEQIGHSTKILDQISRNLSFSCFSLFHPSDIDLSYMKVRSLPTSRLIDLLKEKYGKDDINERNIGAALVDIFGEENVSPKFVKLDLTSTQLLLGSSVKEGLLDRGILLSACQSEQQALEVRFNEDGNIYGTFSNYMQAIIAENDGDVTNKELVLNARKKIQQQNLKQKPGLYCSDQHIDARFLG